MWCDSSSTQGVSITRNGSIGKYLGAMLILEIAAPKALSWIGHGEGVSPSPSDYGSGGASKAPPAGCGPIPGWKRIWRIWKAKERHWFNCLQLHTAAVTNTLWGRQGSGLGEGVIASAPPALT